MTKSEMGFVKQLKMSLKRKTRNIRETIITKIRCDQLGVGDQVILKRTAFRDKHKIQDHWENTVYCVEGQPYSGLPIFRITPITGGGKVRVVYQKLLLPFGGNIVGDPGKEVNQQNVDEH